ncbi:hypothetical protein [Cupriavidus numazuensis]
MITRKPWAYGDAVIGRDYLKQDDSFESLVKELREVLSGIEQSSVIFCIDPEDGKCEDPLLKRLSCERPSWRILMAPKLLDQFFNGRMGIRAQYYRCPYHGLRMNHLLLSTLRSRLVELALDTNCSVSKTWLERSLSRPSAKAWISETTVAGKRLIRDGDSTLSKTELQNDWLDIAIALKAGSFNDDYDRHSAALQGVRCPIPDQLLIKGAWLTKEKQDEYVTPGKCDRHCQLFMFGHT